MASQKNTIKASHYIILVLINQCVALFYLSLKLWTSCCQSDSLSLSRQFITIYMTWSSEATVTWLQCGVCKRFTTGNPPSTLPALRANFINSRCCSQNSKLQCWRFWALIFVFCQCYSLLLFPLVILLSPHSVSFLLLKFCWYQSKNRCTVCVLFYYFENSKLNLNCITN